MADYEFTTGNRRPFFAIIVKNELTNAAVNLTGATVAFYFLNKRTRVAKVSAGSVTLTDATNGQIEYRWGATDLDDPGFYLAEFRITHTDSNVQSVWVDDIEVLEKLQ